ncbi:MAG: hypothetical protein IKZ09_11580 [Clostridia bacterium]|nr:hypothetical protein [Clostridia bacterium]
MMNAKLRLCAAILALASVGAAFVSCGSSDPADTPTTKADNAAETAAATEEVTTDYMPELPAKDYGGDEFLILTSNESDDNGVDWVTKDIYAEATTGDVITDAVYERNMWLEDTFNIKINQFQCVTMAETKKAVQAGVTDYDAVITAIANGCSMGAGNFVLDLAKVPYIDLKQSWWDQGIVRDVTINDRTYIATGDISIVDNDATWVLMFNKAMAQSQDYDLYQLVRDNKWYYDTMYNMVVDCSKDLNGDGKMNWKDDQYGFATTNDSAQGLMYASGLTLSARDSEGYPIISTDLDRLTAVITKAGTFMADKQITILGSTVGSTDELRLIFEGGRALFYGEVMQCVTRMRDSTTDFGLIPWPKFDESQDEFYCYVHSTAGKGVCIPTTQPDPEMAGIIIEAMAAKSVSTVTEAYYDKALTYKYMRDEESAEMMDIILSNRLFDLAYSYNWGSLYSTMQGLVLNGKDTVVSSWDKKLSAAEKAMQKTIDAYRENE